MQLYEKISNPELDLNKESFRRLMLEQPSYASTIHFRINLWHLTLQSAKQYNIFDKGSDHPLVSSLIKDLSIVHGSYERHDVLLAPSHHKKTRYHDEALDPEFKKQNIFFRVEQAIPRANKEFCKLYDEFLQYGPSDYYGPYVHRSSFVSCINVKGKIAPIDNLQNYEYNPRNGKNVVEEMAYSWMLKGVFAFLQKNPDLLEIVGHYYSDYAEMVRSRQSTFPLTVQFYKSIKEPYAAPIDLRKFTDFFNNYPMLALMLFPPPFAEVMIEDRFVPQEIVHLPLENATPAVDWPKSMTNLLLGYIGDDPFN